MTRYYTTLLMFMLVALTSLSANAYDFEVDGIFYRILSAQDRTCEVVYDNSDVNEAREGDIVIPQNVEFRGSEITVTRIGSGAFRDCYNVSSISLPATVTIIESDAFENCSKIVSMNLPENVNYIGSGAFEGCSNLTSINIPNSVSKIQKRTFSGCKKLEIVNLPSNVTTIDDYAFANCMAFTKFELPVNLIRIGEGAFNGCTSICQLSIPSSVNYINKEAFYNCTSLEFVEFEKSNKSLKICSDNGMTIGYKAYYVFDPNGNLKTLKTDRTLIYFPAKFNSLINLELGDDVSVAEFTCGDNLEHIIFGQNTEFQSRTSSDIGMTTDFRKYSNLKSIKCYESSPTFYPNCTQEQYLNVHAYVPNSSLEIYKSSSFWKNFWYLEGFDSASGIETNYSETAKTPIQFLDINGIVHKAPIKGLNIIKYSDGSTHKIYY